MAIPFNMFVHLTCLRIAYFIFALIALNTTKVHGGSSACSIPNPLGQALQSGRLKPPAE